MIPHQPPAEPVPPHAIESEQSLLGAILINNDALDLARQYVQAEDFAEAVHRDIFAAMCARRDAGEPIDRKLMVAVLGNASLAPGVTVNAYLARLVAEATTVSGAPGYARMIAEAAQMRRVLATAQEAVAAMTDGSVRSPAEFASYMIEALDEVASAGLAEHARRVTLGQSVSGVLAQIDRVRRGLVPPGAPYGVPALDRVTLGMRPGQFIVLAGRPGMGKAQPLTSRVHTPQGWRRMGDLAVGDAISSVDGQASEVTGVHEQGRKLVYRVLFSDGRETRCCAEHLWEVSYREWQRPRVIDTSRLIELLGKARYRNRLSIPTHSGEIGQHADLPIHPWLLGVTLGHGSLTGDSIILHLYDSDIRDRVVDLLPPGHGLSHRAHDEYGVTGDMRRNLFKGALVSLGAMGHRSEEKRVPRSYMDAGREQRLALLQGLLDTDGWVEKQGSARYSSASAGLANDVIELARSLGLWAKYSSKAAFVGSIDQGRSQKLDAHVVCISGPTVAETFTLERKAERLRDRSWFRALTITSIEPDGIEACRCISVSHHSRLYVTDDHIVTHNTTAALHVALTAARRSGPVGFFSLEMDAPELSERMLAAVAYDPRHREPITYRAIAEARGLSEEALWRLQEAGATCADIPLWIEQEPGLSLAQIASRARQMRLRAERKGQRLAAIVVDHIGLIRPSKRYSGNRVQEMTEISSGLKGLAKELGIPVLGLSQLNREVEKREDKRPLLSDLRESGSIEQDADVVLGLFREAYYLERKASLSDEEGARLAVARDLLEIEILKQRGGPTIRIECFCDIACNVLAESHR